MKQLCQYAADKLECKYIKRSLYHASKNRKMIVSVSTFKVAAQTRKTLNIDPSILDVDVHALNYDCLLASVHSVRLIQIR